MCLYAKMNIVLASDLCNLRVTQSSTDFIRMKGFIESNWGLVLYDRTGLHEESPGEANDENTTESQ